MKIETVRRFYHDAQKILRCPICHEDVRLHEPASIVCKRGHCFDLSSKGYINLMLHSKRTLYDKSLFESRRMIFNDGFYDPLAREITRLLNDAANNHDNLRLLDVGCGEGYYAAFIRRDFPLWDIYALDSSREAVLMGARQYPGIRWIIGNLANLPFQDGCMDVVMEIFAPANYSEFARIIKAGGYILKAIPGESYLKELRGSIRFHNAQGRYTNRRVIDYFSQNLRVRDIIQINYEKPVSDAMKAHFIKMTPLMFGKTDQDIDLSRIDSFTFDFQILIGQKNNR